MTLSEIDARLEEIEAELAICRAATPGPWVIGKDVDDESVTSFAIFGEEVVALDIEPEEVAAFIASARAGYPRALAGERRLLRALRAAAEAAPSLYDPSGTITMHQGSNTLTWAHEFWRAFNAEKLNYEKEITP